MFLMLEEIVSPRVCQAMYNIVLDGTLDSGRLNIGNWLRLIGSETGVVRCQIGSVL